VPPNFNTYNKEATLDENVLGICHLIWNVLLVCTFEVTNLRHVYEQCVVAKFEFRNVVPQCILTDVSSEMCLYDGRVNRLALTVHICNLPAANVTLHVQSEDLMGTPFESNQAQFFVTKCD